jgi:hypothetical protein
MWRNNEFDMVFGFDSENDALDWIKTQSKAWLREYRRMVGLDQGR